VSRRELGAALWAEAGGLDGSAPTLVLLHGLSATGEVWAGLRGLLDGRWQGRWLVPDLRGHGRSSHAAAYSFGQHAADVAALLRPGERLVVVGHSMGGVVGLALASGWFGVDVAAVVGIGIKVSWTEAELARATDLARRPVRWFEHRGESDGLVTLAELRRLDPAAVDLTGLGHNAHVEAPERVLDLAEQVLDVAGRRPRRDG
jgi:pimeloyl-ACP methyl ester carboxylesterase